MMSQAILITRIKTDIKTFIPVSCLKHLCVYNFIVTIACQLCVYANKKVFSTKIKINVMCCLVKDFFSLIFFIRDNLLTYCVITY